MLEIILCIVLLPFAIGAAVFTGCLIAGTIKGIAQAIKDKT